MTRALAEVHSTTGITPVIGLPIDFNNNKTIDIHKDLMSELKKVICEFGLLTRNREECFSKFKAALSIPRVREILEYDIPKVNDLSDLLKVENNGRVFAIRMDLLKGVGNLKKPVIAGLILKNIIMGKIPRPGIDSLADAGNMNTGFALRYFCNKFGLNGLYIMSHHFPQDMVQLLMTKTFRVIQSPGYAKGGIEEEFYGYLLTIMKSKENRNRIHCLWHAKYGGRVLSPLAEEIAQGLDGPPDYIVVSSGSGATLECLQGIQTYFSTLLKRKSEIVLCEHVNTPIYSLLRPWHASVGSPTPIKEYCSKNGFNQKRFRTPPSQSIPHSVLGPHYNTVNPFLRREIIESVEHVQKFVDIEWMQMSHYLESQNLGVGNSSAANISVATNLANRGYKVLTVIVEPMRSYYKVDRLNKSSN